MRFGSADDIGLPASDERATIGAAVNTLHLFSRASTTVPASTAWYLGDLGKARGKQELFARQAPQRLKALREHALISILLISPLFRLHILLQ
jgi:hypothetical protein